MRLLFNTIMLEVNRWTSDKVLTRPLADLLPLLKKANFSALEIWQYHISRMTDDELSTLKDQLQALEFHTVALGAYPALHLQEADADLERLVGFSDRLGATTFKIFPGRLASADTNAETWRRSLQHLRHLAERLADRGMDLTLETHGNTLCDTQANTQRLLDEIGEINNLGLCFQPYTSHGTGETLNFFAALGSAVRHIHLQNRSMVDNDCTRLADGDWYDCTRLLQAAKASGFAGLLSLEFTAGLFPIDGQIFDPQTVIDNAVQDADFVMQIWNEK
jgi:sugar phosphate isomerase/epimerase